MITSEYKYTDVLIQRFPADRVSGYTRGFSGLYRGVLFRVMTYGDDLVDVMVYPEAQDDVYYVNEIPGTDGEPIGTDAEAIDAAICRIDEYLMEGN